MLTDNAQADPKHNQVLAAYCW